MLKRNLNCSSRLDVKRYLRACCLAPEEELKVNIEKLLTAENLIQNVSVETFSGPRRLTVHATGFPVKQADVIHEVTGPPKSVGYDPAGEPTRAAVSFAEKQGIRLVDIFIVQTPKGEYLAAKQTKRGRTSEQILSEILPRVIHNLSWPRTMTWTGLDGARFIRPIRWIVALLGGKPLKFSFGGIPAGDVTCGHRFLGSSDIRVRDFADYEKKLRAHGVILRPSERREKIERELAAHTKKGGYRLHEDAALLNLVAYLNDYPTVIEGAFDAKFLNLPDEILVTVMRGHQKYFAVEKRNAELAPHFLAVINLAKDPEGTGPGRARAGLSVLASPMPSFSGPPTRKCRLADYLPRLAKVAYESRLGSYADKVERVRSIARWLMEQWFNLGIAQAHIADADRAAELAKCDLATEMVREFPDLAGNRQVGSTRGRNRGLMRLPTPFTITIARLASTIRSHEISSKLRAWRLADQLDSIVGCFVVGIIPTGSSDAYALRRAALGIVKVILDKKLPLSLSQAVASAAKGLAQSSAETQRHTNSAGPGPGFHPGPREVRLSRAGPGFSY